MADISEPDFRYLGLRKKLAHIDQMLADHGRKRQQMRYVPILAVITGMGAGAAFFAAGVAFMKVFGGTS
jgi:hypothetical protein